jgi:hypothetical protein
MSEMFLIPVRIELKVKYINPVDKNVENMPQFEINATLYLTKDEANKLYEVLTNNVVEALRIATGVRKP